MSFRRLRLPRVPRVALVAAPVLLLALGGAWLWLRDSSLVAVQRVSVVGASGPDAGRIRAALRVAGRGMTTLDVNVSALRTAVSPFSVVKDLRVSTHFPQGMVIRVIEQVPVAIVVAETRRVAVAGDGTLLPDVRLRSSLPQLPVRLLPGGTRVTDPRALDVLAVLGAAPWQLLSHITGASSTANHGVVVELRQGPRLYFGDRTLLSAKWTAADEVLADAGSGGASYVDVTDPYRPAAGVTAATGSGGSTGAPAASGAVTGPAAAATGAAAGGPTAPATGAAAGPAAAATGAPAAGAAPAPAGAQTVTSTGVPGA